MSLYTIGDLHLSLGTDKPMDIFRGWEGYLERLTENWNNLVTPEDTVVVIGDISWAMNLKNAVNDFRYINDKLNGSKIILKGNHDYWWTTFRKMTDFLDENGFSTIKILSNSAILTNGVAVCGTRGWINDDSEPFDKKLLLREAIRLEMSVTEAEKLGGEVIAFIHYPPVFGDEENINIIDVLQKHGVSECYYGHVHGAAVRKAFTGERGGINYHIASADCVDFTPLCVKK